MTAGVPLPRFHELLEHTYRLDVEPLQWQHRLAEEMWHRFPSGPGVLSYEFDFRDPEKSTILGRVTGVGDIKGFADQTVSVHESFDSVLYRKLLEGLGSHAATIREGLDRRAWTKVGVHIAAAHRLLRGRWSLVDHIDSDGVHFLLAIRNDPEANAPSSLSRREAQVASYAAMGHMNKEIAYVLGLAVSTVATHLSNALDKLGLGSRTELIWLHGRLHNENKVQVKK